MTDATDNMNETMDTVSGSRGSRFSRHAIESLTHSD